MKKIFTNKVFTEITGFFLFDSLLITILINTNIDLYLSYIILPFIILLISYIILIKKNDLVVNKKAYYYLFFLILILASFFIIKIDISNKLLNIIVIPFLLSIFFLSLTNPYYNINNFFSYFFKLIPNRLFSNLKYLSLLKDEKKDYNKWKNILLGTIIGLPIAIVLLFLLTSADKYFGSLIKNIFSFSKNLFNINQTIINAIIFISVFIVLFSVLVNIFFYRNYKTNEKKIMNVNNTLATTVLIIINLVFGLFLISEISKITGNFLNLPIEYTYAKYAREGFFQLLIITVINISIIIYFLYFTNATNNSKKIKTLTILLIIFSLFLIINSYYRMFLYIRAYGFTPLRLQVILFLAMEFIIFILFIKKIIKPFVYQESYIYLLIILITYILNLYLATEPFINLLNKFWY